MLPRESRLRVGGCQHTSSNDATYVVTKLFLYTHISLLKYRVGKEDLTSRHILWILNPKSTFEKLIIFNFHALNTKYL